MRVGCLLFVLLLLAPTTAARNDDSRADAAYKRYLAARGEQGFRATRSRLDSLRSLGALEGPHARDLLFRIFKSSKFPDDKLLAVTGIGRRGGLGTLRTLAKLLEKKSEPDLMRAWANGLSANRGAAITHWLSTEVIRSSRPEFLEACARALAEHPGHAAAETLLALYEKHAGNRSRVDIAHEAVRALGAVEGEKVTETLLAAAAHKDWRIRLAAADVLPLRDLGNGRILTAVRELLGDARAVVRQTTARGVGEAKLEILVPELIELLEKAPRIRTRHGAYLALKAISGLDFTFDAGAWRQWWKTKEAGQDPSEITFAKYYGFSVMSDRVVFLVDLSGSMNWTGGYDVSRVDVARSELIAVLGELPESCLFNIVVYSSKVREWQRKEVPASPSNVAKATRWITGVFQEPEGDTHTHTALKAAFDRNPEFDSLYFLSDGVPSHGHYVSHEGILASVEVWNRYRRAVIHTFALTFTGRRPDLLRKYQGERSFMTNLAKGTGGEVRIVRRPPR